MDKEVQKISANASNLEEAITAGKNVGVLLYLAKYNPNITEKDIQEKFGVSSIPHVKKLEAVKLVQKDGEFLSLTNAGIFQVDALLSLVP